MSIRRLAIQTCTLTASNRSDIMKTSERSCVQHTYVTIDSDTIALALNALSVCVIAATG